MQYTYDPWYFFGRDFAFKNADNNFDFLEEFILASPDMKMSLFSEYLHSTKRYDKKLKQYTGDFFVY